MEIQSQIIDKRFNYKFERSSDKLCINLVISGSKKIKIILSFPSHHFGIGFKEREVIEDVLDDFLSPDGWYLIPPYFITEVNFPRCKHDNITEFILVRK